MAIARNQPILAFHWRLRPSMMRELRWPLALISPPAAENNCASPPNYRLYSTAPITRNFTSGQPGSFEAIVNADFARRDSTSAPAHRGRALNLGVERPGGKHDSTGTPWLVHRRRPLPRTSAGVRRRL